MGFWARCIEPHGNWLPGRVLLVAAMRVGFLALLLLGLPLSLTVCLPLGTNAAAAAAATAAAGWGFLVVARRDRLLETRHVHPTRGRGTSLLVLALTAVAALVWVVKSLFEVEVRMNKIEESTEEIVDSLLQAFTLPKRALTSLLGVLSSYLRAQVGFDSCFYLDHDADEPVEQLEEGVKENMHILKGAGLDELADGVGALSLSLSLSRPLSLAPLPCPYTSKYGKRSVHVSRLSLSRSCFGTL